MLPETSLQKESEPSLVEKVILDNLHLKNGRNQSGLILTRKVSPYEDLEPIVFLS